MLLDRTVRFLASLRLTVVCLAFAIVLVFAGTMAQVDQGIYAVQANYFRSLFVRWPVPHTGWSIPVLPGGYLIGGVLLVNLLLAHFQRFGLRWNKAGLLMIHFGLILLLLGQLATDLLQRESTMLLAKGQTKNYSEDMRLNELAITDTTDPKNDQVVAIPEKLLANGGEIRHPALPFTVKVINYWPNCRLSTNAVPGSVPVPATRGVGAALHVLSEPPATGMDERSLPGAVVELIGPRGPLGTWLVSAMLGVRQPFTFDNHHYTMALRPARYEQPFSLTLLEPRHDIYPGTDIPKNFSSRVRLRRPDTGEDREVVIRMNNPLRYGGLTFYQYQMAAESPEHTSTLQVVRNPGWLTPYLACTLIFMGLVVQFLIHLLGFVKHRQPNEA
jgi:hypothetical protein